MTDIWEKSDPYEFFMGRWSTLMAPVFLAWLRPPSSARYLEIGCGTGALSKAICDHAEPQKITCTDPSEDFLMQARNRLNGRGIFIQGTASALPVGDHSADVIVSGLALNFFENIEAALQEMRRVVKPGGLISAYVWDYAGKMEMLRYFWDAAIAVDPGAEKLDEGNRFPICSHVNLKTTFTEAGLSKVETSDLDIVTHFKDFNDYWDPFLGEQGPAPGYLASRSEALKEKIRSHVFGMLPFEEDGSVKLIARAIGIKAFM